MATSVLATKNWKKENVKSDKYNLIFDIEKIFVTSLRILLSSVRANNEKEMQTSKRVFSSLFNVNNNRNYSVMDVQTEFEVGLQALFAFGWFNTRIDSEDNAGS